MLQYANESIPQEWLKPSSLSLPISGHNKLNWNVGAGEMAEQLRTWSYGGPKSDNQHPNGCLTTVCNSNFQGPDTLFYRPQVLNL